MDIEINGFGVVSLDELQRDVDAAKEKGLDRQWAFTPETVQGLIDKLKELSK